MGGMKNHVKVFAMSSLRQRARLLLIAFFLALLLIALSFVLLEITVSRAAGTLTVEIITAYNLVVDSNVESPSTYAPSVATVAGRFCNTGDDDLTNVQGYIGNYVDGSNDTPGIYPARTVNAAFTTEHPALDNAAGSTYSFTHVGGRIGTTDATRFIGTLAPNECVMQYWHFTYPQCELNTDGSVDLPPCESGNSPTWGDSVKPEDDLWLDFDIWGTAYDGATTQIADETRTLNMRNEISAMANKIKPNPDGRWFNTKGNTVVAGDVITSNGILYTFGNVRFGFDNDGDYVPDYNAWAQPIGDPNYDPSCFRLIRTSGVLTVSRGGGNPDLIIPFDDQDPSLSEPYGGPLYFTNLPSDNTEVTGEVFYTFLALDGPCSTNLTPYQEVASGYDNEKFNGDYGVGIPPIGSSESEVTIDKSSDPTAIPLGSTTTYRIPFDNTGTDAFGLGLSSGTGMGMMISDTVPSGMLYVGSSATATLSYAGSVTIRYSTDSGQTWSLADPGTITSTSPSSLVIIQWWLDDPLPAGSTGNYAQFQARVPGGYSGSSFIENCAEASLGDGVPFDKACDILVIQGNNSIGDYVWRDENTDGLQTGETNNGIEDVTVWLYRDKDGDQILDSDDVLITTTVTSGTGNNYLFSNLPDGNYLVKVDTTDTDIPTGYRITTSEVYDVDLDSGSATTDPVDYLDADFGFGPALSLDKQLTSGNPSYEGELVTYAIALTNNLPGDGDPPGPCTYLAWGTNSETGVGGAAWNNPTNIEGAPDGSYAAAPLVGNLEDIEVSSYNLAAAGTGTIQTVELLVPVNLIPSVNNSTLDIDLYDGATLIANVVTDEDISTLDGTVVYDVTSLRSWAWADFMADGTISVTLEAKKDANPSGDFEVDAVGFRVTTDASCGYPGNTIDPLPLTDTYSSTQLLFLSATPSATVVSGGVITWTNVGPLYGGQTTTVTVIFRALEPPDTDTDGEPDPTTHQNCADSVGGSFLDGAPTNDPDQDCVNHTINPAGTIGDLVWSDIDGDGVYEPNGADSTPGTADDELGIENVTVNLYQDSDQNGVPDGPAIATLVTDENGYYLFEGLQDGYYIVQVDTTTLPDGGAGAVNTYDKDTDTDSDSGTLTINNNDGNPANDDVLDADFGYTLPTLVEGTIWHDWDRSGDSTRDTGEDWLAGVTVMLDDGVCDTARAGNANDDCLITTTDVNGYFFFTVTTDLAGGTTPLVGGTYTITVDTSDTPTGYSDALSAWTQSYDTDGLGTAHQAAVTVVTGGTGHVDFSYYQTGSSTIGDTVYVDWNGDGDQDSGEEGIAGVAVYLYVDTNGDGVLDVSSDVLISTTVTADGAGADPLGYYDFIGLPAGDYFVVVDEDDLPSTYLQTQDPDEEGVCSTCDGQSDVDNVDGTSSYLDEDFGYKPTGSGSIGDYVWQDDDGDGIQDSGESPLSGIRVTLYEDDNNNGVIDSGDAVVGYQDTDTNGNYLFTGLPAGDYLVDVDTTDSDLPTDGNGDPYVLTTDNDPHDVALSVGEEYLDADFGFTASGSIGDYVWRDNNADGIQDASEDGIPNVTVRLYNDVDGNGIYEAPTDTLRATTTTNASGVYSFTGVPGGTYVVVVDAGTLPSNINAQTYDPDRLTTCADTSRSDQPACDHSHPVNLQPGRFYMSADFGYDSDGVIGDYVWLDADRDGVQDSGELGFGGVVITLTDGVVLTATTDSDGYYSFGGLADDVYTVTVDVSTLPTDTLVATYEYNNTLTPNSLVTVTLSGGTVTNIGGYACTTCSLDIDFGYDYPSGIYNLSGNTFYDEDNDGYPHPETGEDPYPGVTVYLWQDEGGGSYTLQEMTDTLSSGYYIFTSLYTGTYKVSTSPTAPGGEDITTSNVLTGTGIVLNDFSPSSTDNDFGFYGEPPTAVTLSLFEAEWREGRVVVTWETALEIDTVGFNLWRSTSSNGVYERVNDRLIPAESLGGVWGGSYEVIDTGVTPGTVCYYKLEELEVGGKTNWYGPVSTDGGNPTSVTSLNVGASSGANGVWWVASAVAVLSLPLVALVRLRRRRR